MALTSSESTKASLPEDQKKKKNKVESDDQEEAIHGGEAAESLRLTKL